MISRTHRSPDAQHELVLTFDGEIRFGPAYLRAALDGEPLGDRRFGNPVLWSDDSRFLVLQQWNSVEDSRGLDTTLFVVRVRDRAYDDSIRHDGFIEPRRFEGSTLHYELVGHGSAVVDLAVVTGWSTP